MENSENRQPQVEQEIDLLELAKKLWVRRKTFYKALGGALIVGLVIAFSIPKEYSVTVTLAPESTRRTSSSLASVAAMMGLGNLASSSESDALNVLLFPDILASNPFALELYDMPVKPVESDTVMALNEYMGGAKTSVVEECHGTARQDNWRNYFTIFFQKGRTKKRYTESIQAD